MYMFQKKTEIISPTATASPLPKSLPTIVSPTSITPTDTMKTSLTALTTVSTASNSSRPTIITEIDISPYHTDKSSNFSSESFPPLTHVSTMTFPINIPKNHYELGDYDGHVLEKNLNAIYDIIVYWKKNLFMFPTGRVGKDYIR